MWRNLRAVLFIAALLCPRAAHAGGLDRWQNLVVAELGGARKADGIRITYLGVNGYLLQTGGRALLVDPYFTRVPLADAALNLSVASDPKLVAAGLLPLPRRIDALLVTHGHIDHLLDAPEIMRRTGARLVASASSVNLVVASGLPPRRCAAVAPGGALRIGPWKVRVLRAAHDRLFCHEPFPGEKKTASPTPHRPADWVAGETLAFVVEAAGQRIYIDAGGMPGAELPPADVAPVDLAILGVALPDSRHRLAPVARRLRPRFVLPSHQDDFFRPLARGFSFGLLTDFPAVRRASAAGQIPGRLILLDYYRPWTLR